jgi:hypothetical protein
MGSKYWYLVDSSAILNTLGSILLLFLSYLTSRARAVLAAQHFLSLIVYHLKLSHHAAPSHFHPLGSDLMRVIILWDYGLLGCAPLGLYCALLREILAVPLVDLDRVTQQVAHQVAQSGCQEEELEKISSSSNTVKVE